MEQPFKPTNFKELCDDFIKTMSYDDMDIDDVPTKVFIRDFAKWLDAYYELPIAKPDKIED